MTLKRGGGRQKTSPHTIEVKDRLSEALKLRRAGKSYEQIAEALGYAGSGAAYNAVNAALREGVQEPAREVRRLEVERLDALLEALWPQAMAGDGFAVDRVLKIQERRAKYLGLDAPPKAPVEDLDQLIERELNRIAGMEEPSAAAETPTA